ncbi:MAG: hypothetical protein II919_08340 [Lachnospiraceae bacterium]|nr:hypothetical protein [Lachnospiraceae bacterium]
MEERNLSKALDIIARLINGEEISRDEKDTKSLYEDYTTNAEIYDITNSICKKLNLSLYEYEYSLYASAGENNRVFGYSNDELKKEIGVKLNRELFLCYFIIYNVVTWFYNDTASYTFNEYIKIEDLIHCVDSSLAGVMGGLSVVVQNEVEENSFKMIALLWENLPVISNEETNARAARGSKYGFVKMTLNFLLKQGLLIESEGRYYPKKRLKALARNYFEEYKGRLYEIMEETGNATYQQNQSK